MAAAAFFDVDETLIQQKSMFTFLELYCEQEFFYDGKKDYHHALKSIQDMAASGASREEVNAYYYELFVGVRCESLFAAGKRWYDFNRIGKNFFHENVLRELKQLQQEGVKIVFVSGSMLPILQLIGDELGVDSILCSQFKVADGKVASGLSQQAIGKGKRVLVSDYILKHALNKEDCYAYGDHISDLPMLQLVGHPVAVDPSYELALIAQREQWVTLLPSE